MQSSEDDDLMEHLLGLVGASESVQRKSTTPKEVSPVSTSIASRTASQARDTSGSTRSRVQHHPSAWGPTAWGDRVQVPPQGTKTPPTSRSSNSKLGHPVQLKAKADRDGQTNIAAESNGLPGRLGRCRLTRLEVDREALNSAPVRVGVSDLVRYGPSQRASILQQGAGPRLAVSSPAVLFGCVAGRSQPRQSKRGSSYFVLTLTDFASEVALFVFDQAANALRRARDGAVVAVSGPSLVPPQHGDRSRSGFALSVAHSAQCRLVAWCADFGRCTARVGGGHSSGETRTCGRAVDARVSRLCPDHQLQLMANNGSIQASLPGKQKSRSTPGGDTTTRKAGAHVVPRQVDRAAAASAGRPLPQGMRPPPKTLASSLTTKFERPAAATARQIPDAPQTGDPLAAHATARRNYLVAADKHRSDLTSFGSSAAASRNGTLQKGNAGGQRRPFTASSGQGSRNAAAMPAAAGRFASAGCTFDPETAAQQALFAKAAGLRLGCSNPKVSGGVAGSYRRPAGVPSSSGPVSSSAASSLNLLGRRSEALARRAIKEAALRPARRQVDPLQQSSINDGPRELVSVGTDGRVEAKSAAGHEPQQVPRRGGKLSQVASKELQRARDQVLEQKARIEAKKHSTMSRRGAMNVSAAVESRAVVADDEEETAQALHKHRKRQRAGPGKALAMQRFLEDKERKRRDAQEREAAAKAAKAKAVRLQAEQRKRRFRSVDLGRVDEAVLEHARLLTASAAGGAGAGASASFETGIKEPHESAAVAKKLGISVSVDEGPPAGGRKRARSCPNTSCLAQSDGGVKRRRRVEQILSRSRLLGDLSDSESEEDGDREHDGTAAAQQSPTSQVVSLKGFDGSTSAISVQELGQAAVDPMDADDLAQGLDETKEMLAVGGSTGAVAGLNEAPARDPPLSVVSMAKGGHASGEPRRQSLASAGGLAALRGASLQASGGRIQNGRPGTARLHARLDRLEQVDDAVAAAVEAGEGGGRIEFATVWACSDCRQTSSGKPTVCLDLGHSVKSRRVRCYFHMCRGCSRVSRSFRAVRTQACRCGAGSAESVLVDSRVDKAIRMGGKAAELSGPGSGSGGPVSGDHLKPRGDGLFAKSLRFE